MTTSQQAPASISRTAPIKAATSASPSNGPKLARTVLSGKDPIAWWTHGAQCNPVRTAMSCAAH